MNEENLNETVEEAAPPTILDIDSMDSQARTTYILNVRRRINDGEEVSDDEIRDSVRLIRLSRSSAAKSTGTKKDVPVISLKDF